jgi:hypothetical protein
MQWLYCSLINLSHIASEILTFAMFIIVNLETVFITEFVGIYMIYAHIKFYMLNSSGSLVIYTELKAKCRFYTATILLS